MGQISITFTGREDIEEAIKELQACLERSNAYVGVEVPPAHFKGVEFVSALGVSEGGRSIQRNINFERGILTARTSVLDVPFHRF